MKAILRDPNEEKDSTQIQESQRKKQKTYKAIKPTNIKRCIYMKTNKQKTHFSLIVRRRQTAAPI